MLWIYLKENMLRYPSSTLRGSCGALTFEETAIFAERFAMQIVAPYCAVLCRSEMAAALALLGCFAAGVPAVPLPFEYGTDFCKRIVQEIKPPCMITDISGELRIVKTGISGDIENIVLTEDYLLTKIDDISANFEINRHDSTFIYRPLYRWEVLIGEFLISLVKGMQIQFAVEKFNPKSLRHSRSQCIRGTFYDASIYGPKR